MCRFEICFSDKPIGFDDGWTVGGKERKESRMTLWFLLDSQYGWVDAWTDRRVDGWMSGEIDRWDVLSGYYKISYTYLCLHYSETKACSNAFLSKLKIWGDFM